MEVEPPSSPCFCLLTAASTLAGLSALGSASRLITERRILPTLCTGDQLEEQEYNGAMRNVRNEHARRYPKPAPLSARLVAVGVVAWRMENGDADAAVGVDYISNEDRDVCVEGIVFSRSCVVYAPRAYHWDGRWAW